MRTHTNNILLLLLLGSLLALMGAYISEYGFGMKPCHLCLYQRIPYAIVIALCGLGLCLRGWVRTTQLLIALSIVALLADAGLAAYHVGVEQGIFQGLEGCGSNLPEGTLTLQQLKEQIMAATTAARCDKPAFVLFGISMAGWNILYATGLCLLGCIIWIRRGKHS